MASSEAARSRAGARRRADLALLGVAAIWGATFVLVKDALAGIGPLTFVAFRFALAAAALLPFLHLWRRDGFGIDGPEVGARSAVRPGGRLQLAGAGAAVGACLFAGYAFQTAGLQFVGAARAGFITGLSVVMVPLFAAAVDRRLPDRRVALGIGLATGGLGLLSLLGEGGAVGGADGWGVSLGDLLVFGCACGFALHIMAVGRFAPRHRVLSLTFAQIAVVATLGAVAAAIWEAPTTAALVSAWPAAASTGLLGTAVGFLVQTRAQRQTSPTHTALIFSTEPVFAALFAYAFAGERLGAPELLGCALILGGMLVVQLAPSSAGPAADQNRGSSVLC